MMLFARWLNKYNINLWATNLKVSCGLQRYRCSWSKARAKPKLTETERKIYPPFEYNTVQLFRMILRHIPNGAFRNVMRLNLSDNKLTTLAGCCLHLLPRPLALTLEIIC